MKTNMITAVAVAVMGLAGAAQAQDYAFNWTPAGTVSPTPPAPAFLMLAGGSDLYEIESSRAVLETTADAGIRTFAEMMIAHHTKTSADATAAAQAAGLTPPAPMLSAPQAAMVAALRGYEGVERDRLYLTQQMMAHKEALGVMRTYSETGDTPQLRTAAGATVPIVQRHLSEVERLARR
ncbi:hypothetical protein BZG35_13840 [Brevundimonas sp. LM2]|uniref:DUF4142 domain-containing protein n=1 Tax=Brevundimonas sp. LM2 TaxID=1938605 RepID=UPI00098395D1|nr:DUF4142 domain-containing protein [Brevundimonas sp. LM2]AQR62607.1 hypothetical protein BZG35_13840 [Brevundimonas sp. LM2]